jgi:hypothetical protein
MIWVRKDLHAKQIPIASADLTAVLLQAQDRLLFVVSVYIPPRASDSTLALEQRLTAIREAYYTTRRQAGREVEILVAGDFNRHDLLWGGDQVALSDRQGEAAPIIELAEDLDLQCLLPRGTITYEGPRGCSTIDLIFASSVLAEELSFCKVYEGDHGSDHRAVQTGFFTSVHGPSQSARFLFRAAPWDTIRRTVSASLEQCPSRPESVDAQVQRILDVVLPAVHKHVPKARPSPFAKRWWTIGLTQLRNDYRFCRNQERAARRGGATRPELMQQALAAKRSYFAAIRKQKQHHWRAFLDDNANI